ncbi:ornithine cyclodeaminase family protein [Amycolatopsis acidicola]|uniref:Ornithine cyclodeaminase family protein n=1 Tax=Amycolatopsis acidicola TaxID=2596893 RepID=A0A5N0VJJ6_9PSEU|nr:ornithine cyclodeaminase family protein [Amycolatopsis acidicola]KAA9165848.1 ornithine cyclodeaminase family protein [Amycolatopsis acidicola]
MVLILTNADITAALSTISPDAVIDAVEAAHADLAAGLAAQPARVPAAVPGSTAVLVPMTAALAHTAGVKLLADVPANASAGRPVQQSSIVLVDPATGTCEAFLDGAAITRRRTAATSAVATRYLARADSRVLGLVGAGAQARAHLDAIRRVRPIDQVVVWSRRQATAARFAEEMAEPGLRIDVAETPQDAVRPADIVCTLTPSRTPIVCGAWFPDGLHVNAVGAPPRPDHREIDTDAVTRSRLVLDSLHTATHESGAIMIPLAAGALRAEDLTTELGDVVRGAKTGRATATGITLFNSVGLPIQDMATARLVLDTTRAHGLGTPVDLSARQPVRTG